MGVGDLHRVRILLCLSALVFLPKKDGKHGTRDQKIYKIPTLMSPTVYRLSIVSLSVPLSQLKGSHVCGIIPSLWIVWVGVPCHARHFAAGLLMV